MAPYHVKVQFSCEEKIRSKNGFWWESVGVAALATLKWKHNKWMVALAVLVMLAVFTIPHSKNGSEYDYASQELSTGK